MISWFHSVGPLVKILIPTVRLLLTFANPPNSCCVFVVVIVVAVVPMGIGRPETGYLELKVEATAC